MRLILEATTHKIYIEKVYDSPEIHMDLTDCDGYGEVCVGLTVEHAKEIAESLQRALKEHADFYERIRQEMLRISQFNEKDEA